MGWGATGAESFNKVSLLEAEAKEKEKKAKEEKTGLLPRKTFLLLLCL